MVLVFVQGFQVLQGFCFYFLLLIYIERGFMYIKLGILVRIFMFFIYLVYIGQNFVGRIFWGFEYLQGRIFRGSVEFGFKAWVLGLGFFVLFEGSSGCQCYLFMFIVFFLLLCCFKLFYSDVIFVDLGRKMVWEFRRIQIIKCFLCIIYGKQ